MEARPLPGDQFYYYSPDRLDSQLCHCHHYQGCRSIADFASTVHSFPNRRADECSRPYKKEASYKILPLQIPKTDQDNGWSTFHRQYCQLHTYKNMSPQARQEEELDLAPMYLEIGALLPEYKSISLSLQDQGSPQRKPFWYT